jgi:ketosteroid isomerase-like protein
MTTSTDLRASASAVMHDGDTDLEAFFGHFADDCRFAWGNEEPVQGLEAIQALVGRMLAGITGLRHDVHEQLVSDDAIALRMDVTYTLPDGGELHTPAVTYMRFSDDRIVEYLIYQDPAPLRAAASAE